MQKKSVKQRHLQLIYIISIIITNITTIIIHITMVAPENSQPLVLHSFHGMPQPTLCLQRLTLTLAVIMMSMMRIILHQCNMNMSL
jgi:hypothetical protein